MPSAIRAKSCLHLLTVGWVLIWVVTVPLFHTHLPDVNDLSSPHGLAHTVFSPDLPGEFVAHGNGFQLSTKSQNSPELGFVLSTSQDTKKKIYKAPSLFPICCWQFERHLLVPSDAESQAVDRKFTLLAGQGNPRAPPFIVSS
jgi:hypothetical protein